MQQYFRTTSCVSPDHHLPIFSIAAASLESSTAASQSDAATAMTFLKETSSHLAAAYEQLSTSTFAAHALRQKSPCVRHVDVMRCCSVNVTALSSKIAGNDEIPYPKVLGSNFDISCLSGFHGFTDVVDRRRSISADCNRNVLSSEDAGCPVEIHEPLSKRPRVDLNDAEAWHSIVPGGKRNQNVISSIYLQNQSRMPRTTATPTHKDFDWLPGNGVLS